MTCNCLSCGRRFVVVQRADSANARCVCGAALATAELHEGIYEIKRSRHATRRRAPRKVNIRSRNDAKGTSMPVEPDQGYGESHGYGPAHGGPTGPGDAPARETSETTDTAAANERG